MGLLDTTVGEVTTPGILSNIGSVMGKLFDWIPEMFDAITENPLLLLAVGISVTGIVISTAIGIFKRV